MQLAEKNATRSPRKFKVGLVGTTYNEFCVIQRIFTVTDCRTRSYVPVALEKGNREIPNDIDFIVLCSANPQVIAGWRRLQQESKHPAFATPFVYLTRSASANLGKYQMVSPINPSKLVKLLDQYTIRELNYLPEFEIGNEDGDGEEFTVSGLEILKFANDRAASSKAHRSRALVVDDSLAVRKQMEIEFSLLDNELDVAASAEEALHIVSEKVYDVIFLDVVMPGMDGYTACKKIKRDSLNKKTPVILLTSRSSSFDKIKGALAGCDAYLVKPINHNEFSAIYNKYVNTAQEQ